MVALILARKGAHIVVGDFDEAAARGAAGRQFTRAAGQRTSRPPFAESLADAVKFTIMQLAA